MRLDTEVLRKLVLLVLAEMDIELVLDSLWKIEPMKLGMQKSRQTTATTDDTCSDI